MKTICIKKIDTVSTGIPAMSMQEYIPGTGNNIAENKSLPIEYTIEGELISPIEIGKGVNVLRTKRNGVDAAGFFQTSKVIEITENTFKTQNSVYAYNYI